MGKDLSEMTLEELWQLFPISLVKEKEVWQEWYEEIVQELSVLLPNDASYSIHHIGSTAIDGIMAKNIVDVLVELPVELEMTKIADILATHDYRIMSAENERISLNKGYTTSGFAEKVYHIHLRFLGDNEEVLFRDYLNIHPAIAAEYEALKIRLSKEFEHDRDGYTNAKGDFIKKWTAVAKTQAI
ncbi:GrpB family protein [Candidatus Enterococcus clewellii]|uniref:GrpB family protein n=1 Tax=Candidatus Enterococcus clewellii TaxID=1834193 RepID=A0A242KCQ1_9ENTE|nr:GrpB family protein [Enterococcus sp. 9E7_DIV0242]OTP18837.1 hypothetical protein A5888_000651 [Enterococcus sp. 9E7_DIV0242]